MWGWLEMSDKWIEFECERVGDIEGEEPLEWLEWNLEDTWKELDEEKAERIRRRRAT